MRLLSFYSLSRYFLYCLLWLLSSNLKANEANFKLSKIQLYNLGIKLGALKEVSDIPVLSAPAKVVIPPNQQYIVSTSQAGLVSQLNKSIGDRVKKGELLAQIKSPELLSLQQQFLRASSERELAWATFQRDKRLFDEGIIANKRLQESRSQHNRANVEVNVAKQFLNIAGMSKHDVNKLAKTQHLNSELNIYAPITGVILDRVVVAGERLDMLAPLYRIANLDQLWLEINIPQEQIGVIKVGDKVSIDNSHVHTKISLLTQSVNLNNQSVLARAIIKGTDSKLRVGQNVSVHIKNDGQQTAFKVPNVAIAQSDGQAYIFIRTETGFLVKKITIIGKDSDSSVIKGSLDGTEEVALRGAVALKANWLGLGSDK